MCKLLLHCLHTTSCKSRFENVDGRGLCLTVCRLLLQHTDVYHQDINYNCLYLLYEGDSKSKGKIHLTAVIQGTVSNFTYYFST